VVEHADVGVHVVQVVAVGRILQTVPHVGCWVPGIERDRLQLGLVIHTVHTHHLVKRDFKMCTLKFFCIYQQTITS